MMSKNEPYEHTVYSTAVELKARCKTCHKYLKNGKKCHDSYYIIVHTVCDPESYTVQQLIKDYMRLIVRR